MSLISMQLVVKVVMHDGSSKTLMVDERQTVRDVLDNLFEKTHCDCNVDWSLSETNPELQLGEPDPLAKHTHTDPRMHAHTIYTVLWFQCTHSIPHIQRVIYQVGFYSGPDDGLCFYWHDDSLAVVSTQ